MLCYCAVAWLSAILPLHGEALNWHCESRVHHRQQHGPSAPLSHLSNVNVHVAGLNVICALCCKPQCSLWLRGPHCNNRSLLHVTLFVTSVVIIMPTALRGLLPMAPAHFYPVLARSTPFPQSFLSCHSIGFSAYVDFYFHSSPAAKLIFPNLAFPTELL